MTTEAVIFDLDGTLIDTLQDLGDALNRVLREHGFATHDDDDYKLLIGRGIKRLVTDALPAAARDEATIAECYEKMLADYGEHCLDKTRPYDGVPELLVGLRSVGLPLAISSNKADEFTQRLVTALFAAGTFAVVLGAGPDVPLKPDPVGALLIAERLAVAPGAIAYAGDSGTDMATAVRAGMLPVGVTWGFRSRDELLENGAAVVIDRPGELLDLLALPGR